jgi:hypothetical protein
MKQQTATEWLFTQLYEKFEMKGDGEKINEILNKAIEMEKQQTDKAYYDGVNDERKNTLRYKYLSIKNRLKNKINKLCR